MNMQENFTAVMQFTNSHNGALLHVRKYWTTTILCCTNPVHSLYLLLLNVLIENQRQLAQESSNDFPAPVEMDTKTPWPATKCLMASHCSRGSCSYPKCSTASAKAASISIILHMPLQSHNDHVQQPDYYYVIIQRTQKSWGYTSLRQELVPDSGGCSLERD